MKKILIVNNNMKVGGVQKSLCNLLWELEQAGKYDVTLFLFNPVGAYMEQLPQSTRVLTAKSLFRYLGVSQGEMHGIDIIKRGFLAAVCRTLGRNAAMKLILLSQKVLPEEYDVAVAFLHNGKKRSFFGGVQDFVLGCTKSKKKVAFLHGDYDKCGANHALNNRIMAKFNVIAACSDGCRGVFEKAVPELAGKSMTVRNCNNIVEIVDLAEHDSIIYDSDQIHVLCAARLSPDKGVDRAILAIHEMRKKEIPVCLHILGGGVIEAELKQMVCDLYLENSVFFYGEQSNPYRYMKNADLFLLTSYHEAAPMVIDEAFILGVPVLTTRTSSSDEMVAERACGWVCENDQNSLNEMLYTVLSDSLALRALKAELRMRKVDNAKAVGQFENMIEG